MLSPPSEAFQPGQLSQGMEGFGRRSADAYLESAIATATPARLRLMLIERAVEVARFLAHHWRESPSRGTNEHSLKLFELLTELLSGVTGEASDVCRDVADLYVFLCQHVISAEEQGDASKVDEVRLVLEVEAETWRMVCAKESIPKAQQPSLSSSSPPQRPSGGLNFEA
ncbi:MAG: flagellar export chaperone FliS [Planctomycetota bacterium]